jgi:triosephosphate isomerase
MKSVVTLAAEVEAGLKELGKREGEREEIVFVSPTSLHLTTVAAAAPSLSLSLQNGPTGPGGALTGQVSLTQGREVGVRFTLVGHSERRHVVKEPLSVIEERVKEVLRFNEEREREGESESKVKLVLCVGEELADREAGRTMSVVKEQLSPLTSLPLSLSQASCVIIAYEPVWAIGTGKTATPEMAQETHAEIRAHLSASLSPSLSQLIPIMYGGSVKPASSLSLSLMPDIDGFLVGGASLKAKDFCDIIRESRGGN